MYRAGEFVRALQQVIFRCENTQGEKVAENESTLPSGESKVQEIFNDTAIGYNKLDENVVRITGEQPVFERPADSSHDRPKLLSAACGNQARV